MDTFRIDSLQPGSDHNNCGAIGSRIGGQADYASEKMACDANYNQACATPSRITARAFGTVTVDMPLADAKRLLAMAEQSVRVSRALEQYTPDVALLESLNRALRREIN